MNMQAVRQAHIDWMAGSTVDVYATLKFQNGYDLAESKAEQILSIYLNTLDRVYFEKRQIRAGLRVERFAFLHKGRSGQNTHYHIAFKSLGPLPQFCDVAHTLWHRDFQETSGATSQIGEIRSLNAASVYSLHEFGTLGARTFLTNLSHTNQAPATGITKSIRLTRRLLKALEGND
jgi:hypothetical protein